MGAMVSAGIAVGDYNGDGWLDLYLAQGDSGVSKLFENRSQGGSYGFVDVAVDAGVAGQVSDRASGPAFIDYDGDGDMDCSSEASRTPQCECLRISAMAVFRT